MTAPLAPREGGGGVIRVWRNNDSRWWNSWYWTEGPHDAPFGVTLTRRGALREARRYLRRKARRDAATPTVYTYPMGDMGGVSE